MTKKTYCYECGEEIQDNEDMYNIGNDDYVCEDCRDNYYIQCEDCDRFVLDDNIVTADDNRYICNDCADDHYYTCDHCNELYSSRHLSIDTGYTTLCDNCYSEYYFTCPGCDEVYHTDAGEYVDDCYYCSYCANEMSSDVIRSYSYKPRPVFYGGDAGYGLEVEIDDGNDLSNAAQDINEAGDGHIYLKDDGSLSSQGMEIVTHPASLDYHVNNFPWADICETALSYGFRSHNTDTCGLHIHASRSLFGDDEKEQDLTIAKIILLVDRWYDTYIVDFARRSLSKMQRWAGKPNADIRPEDGDIDAVYKSKKYAGDRYRAINLCNYHTVEFRFFRGTLKRDTIIASIQWVDTMIKYCRETALKDLWAKDWDDIFSNTEHKELTSYLRERNLYNLKGDR